MEDIKIINIDFKANKERIRKQINDKKRKEKKLNRILNIAIIIGLLIGVIAVLILNKKLTDSAMESCQNLGHSYNYCIAHV